MNTLLDCLIIKFMRRNPNNYTGEKITFLPDLTGSSDIGENNIKLNNVQDIDKNECCQFKTNTILRKLEMPCKLIAQKEKKLGSKFSKF